ncbi:MAG: hypothetical protein K4H23_04855, partial [Mollicutes bacterium PWAP]|nr:hypothetical protein [Mollicutes bacterium PWAP]
IFTLIVLVAIFIGFLVYKFSFKKKNIKKSKIIIYSFLFGFSIVMATLGLFNMARNRLNTFFIFQRKILHMEWDQIAIVVIFFILITLLSVAFYFISIYIINLKNNNKINKNIHHKKSINIFEQFVRRIPIGVIGTLSTNPGANFNGEDMLILLILVYALFDNILVYIEFKQVHSNKKALIFSLMGIIIHFPLIILDAIFSNLLGEQFWWKPFIFIMVGTVYLLNAFFKYLREILREVVIKHDHYETLIEGDHHHDSPEINLTVKVQKISHSINPKKSKTFNLTIGTIIFSSITFATIILSIGIRI